MSQKMILGYWAIRGRAQPLRHLLAYCQLDFEEKTYMSPELYGKDMAQCGINFPNLPYMIDGELKFSETLAIARYIIRKSGKLQLLGKTPKDEAMMNNVYIAFNDLLGPFAMLFYSKKINDLKTPLFYKSKQQLNKIEKFLENKEYSIGYLTMADFFIAEGSYFIEKLFPEQYLKLKGINKIRESVMQLPEVKAYYERENAILTPFLPPQMSSIPFFWPGTEPKAPPPPPISSVIKTVVQNSSDNSPTKQVSNTEEQQTKVELKQEIVEQEQVVEKEEIKVSAQVHEEPKYYPPPEQDEFYQPANGPIKICVISGSVSGMSPINYFLGKLAAFSHPAFEFQWADISSLQLHNEDIDQAGTDNANNLRGQVYGCQAVLFGASATHHGVSVALSNAFNWLVPVITSKPVGVVSLQCPQNIENSFRDALKGENVPLMQNIYFGVNSSGDFFDESGEIKEQKWSTVKGFFNSFAKFIEYIQSTMQ